MSYPYQIHTLIVEDELSVRDGYTALFESLNSADIIAPTFAVSFEDANDKLKEPFVYHLVIIDLGLPYKTREEASAGIEPGLELVKQAARREHHPVPAVLVISGRLGLDAKLPDLQHQLNNEFWYGCMLNKGPEVTSQIKKAFGCIHRYCGVGIHLQDEGTKWYPTISPREEDMIRRCILAGNAIGVDMKWWRAESGTTIKEGDKNTGPTKVLMGRIILADGQGTSRPTFFKFEPVGNAQNVFHNADIMDQKLRHIKVIHKAESSTRALLVTQSVCDNEPIALDEFLCEDPNSVSTCMARVVNDIKTQLDALGAGGDVQMLKSQVPPRYLDSRMIDNAWEKYAPEDPGLLEGPNPGIILDHLAKSDRTVWVKKKAGNHGDLNASNVVIEKHGADVGAFIIDAGAIQPDIGARDLAYLEVTSLLFHDAEDGRCLVSECSEFYSDSKLIPPGVDYTSGSSLARNVKSLIREIRTVLMDECDIEVYALLVFSAALSQLSGLAIAPAGNKIRNPVAAARLASKTARWIAQIAPDIA